MKKFISMDELHDHRQRQAESVMTDYKNVDRIFYFMQA